MMKVQKLVLGASLLFVSGEAFSMDEGKASAAGAYSAYYSETSSQASLQQATLMVSQAISVLQYGSDMLGATSEILARMKEITESANSGTVDTVERDKMNEEFQNLLNQITLNTGESAADTRWGEKSLFEGSEFK
jgi:flagellin-like hook-associated protein FlgL